MEFKSLKNIETSFRQIRLFGIVMVSLCAFIAIGAVVLSLNFAEKQREKIYVHDNGKSFDASLVAGYGAEPPGRGTGTRATLP